MVFCETVLPETVLEFSVQSAAIVDAAAQAPRRIARDGAVRERQSAAIVDAAATENRCIPRDGEGPEGHGTGIIDAATTDVRRIARDDAQDPEGCHGTDIVDAAAEGPRRVARDGVELFQGQRVAISDAAATEVCRIARDGAGVQRQRAGILDAATELRRIARDGAELFQPSVPRFSMPPPENATPSRTVVFPQRQVPTRADGQDAKDGALLSRVIVLSKAPEIVISEVITGRPVGPYVCC